MTRIPISTQRRRRPDAPLPSDIRALNWLTALCLLAFTVLVLWSGWALLVRSSHFAVRSVALVTPLERASLVEVQALAAPRMRGNFFDIDIGAAKAAVESVPWVRRASVRRVWPNTLEVSLEEHRAVAYWQGDEGDEQLVNEYGEVFDANLGEVGEATLPTLEGPRHASRHMLVLHLKLAPMMKHIDGSIEVLRVSRRGSWQVVLEDGAEIDLGRGKDFSDFHELLARTDRFVRTFAEVSDKHGKAGFKRADLRYPQGYALQLNNDGEAAKAQQAFVATRNLIEGRR
jgi:cell division protein FtsQ